MRRFLLTGFLALLYFCGSAQQYDNYIRAQMRDGSIYIGNKISEVDEHITMSLSVGDTISFDRVLSRRILDDRNAIFFEEERHHKLSGGSYAMSVGLGSSLFASEPLASIHIEHTYLWRLTPRISSGPILGTEFNEARVAGFTFNTSFVSFGIGGRYYFNENRRRIYSFARLAYGISSEETDEDIPTEHTGGSNFLAGIGVQFPYRRNSSFHFSIGQYVQGTTGSEFFLDTLGNEIETEFDITIRRLILRFSWDF